MAQIETKTNIKTRKNGLSNGKTKKQRVFKKGDFYSGDGFLTTVWGPTQWHMFHTISFNYPVNPSNEDKKNYMDFIRNLVNVLPCKFCRMNLKTNFKFINREQKVIFII